MNVRAEDPNLWSDTDAAQKILRERTKLDSSLALYRKLEGGLADSLGFADLAEAEGDEAVHAEAVETLRAIQTKAKQLELEGLLSGEADGNDAFLEVHAGAGGTESQDWAEMLLR
ncbi:MAG: PCRF domain-containing protein, partial [Alphaproteobacteria bacterium]|nr:PCRF domain-containing protein [Alphaproteobacteria bacterium]